MGVIVQIHFSYVSRVSPILAAKRKNEQRRWQQDEFHWTFVPMPSRRVVNSLSYEMTPLYKWLSSCKTFLCNYNVEVEDEALIVFGFYLWRHTFSHQQVTLILALMLYKRGSFLIVCLTIDAKSNDDAMVKFCTRLILC